jgi:uncharacterized protein (DUF1330 family)
MSAYCLFFVREISDPEKLGTYRNGVVESVTRHGGSYLVLGGATDALEEARAPIVSVLVQFPSLDAAHAWYDSDDYTALRQLRLAASRTEAFFMEGLPPDVAAAMTSNGP